MPKIKYEEDDFQCEECGIVLDIEDSIKIEHKYLCPKCADLRDIEDIENVVTP